MQPNQEKPQAQWHRGINFRGGAIILKQPYGPRSFRAPAPTNWYGDIVDRRRTLRWRAMGAGKFGAQK